MNEGLLVKQCYALKYFEVINGFKNPSIKISLTKSEEPKPK